MQPDRTRGQNKAVEGTAVQDTRIQGRAGTFLVPRSMHLRTTLRRTQQAKFDRGKRVVIRLQLRRCRDICRSRDHLHRRIHGQMGFRGYR